MNMMKLNAALDTIALIRRAIEQLKHDTGEDFSNITLEVDNAEKCINDLRCVQRGGDVTDPEVDPVIDSEPEVDPVIDSEPEVDPVIDSEPEVDPVIDSEPELTE